jgi:hypothetical protein
MHRALHEVQPARGGEVGRREVPVSADHPRAVQGAEVVREAVQEAEVTGRHAFARPQVRRHNVDAAAADGANPLRDHPRGQLGVGRKAGGRSGADVRAHRDTNSCAGAGGRGQGRLDGEAPSSGLGFTLPGGAPRAEYAKLLQQDHVGSRPLKERQGGADAAAVEKVEGPEALAAVGVVRREGVAAARSRRAARREMRTLRAPPGPPRPGGAAARGRA